MRYYVGLATTFHDSALAIVGPDGEVLFAEATERHLQYKRAPNCDPDSAVHVGAILERWIPPGSEIVIATSWSGRFHRLLDGSARAGLFDFESVAGLSRELTRALAPERSERALTALLHLMQRRAGLGTLLALDRAGGNIGIAGIRRFSHHLCHAAYGCWSSPFDEAACLVVDGVGETGASSIFAYRDGRVSEVKRHSGRESIGLFFGLVTDLAGFDQVKGEEWKIMGLAPYGRRDPDLLALLHRLYRVENGQLVFADAATLRDVVHEILERRPAHATAQGWPDLARCGQDVFEEMMDARLAETEALGLSKNLVLSGGCALNSSYNGKILSRSSFAALHVPSAPADDGNAVGAAWLAYAEDHPGWQPPPRALSPFLGSTVSTEPLARMSAWEPRLKRLAPDALVETTARILADGKVVGWVQGRAEFGPRALGGRSILADPRPADAKDLLNAKVKYRETFRPFAPSILAEHAAEWFDEFQDSPYMERTLRWREAVRARVPAVVHQDGTGRLQTVTAAQTPRYHALLSAFRRVTGVPVLLNTSFNIMGKPIVHSAEDAILMFYTTGLDALVIEDWLLVK